MKSAISSLPSPFLSSTPFSSQLSRRFLTAPALTAKRIGISPDLRSQQANLSSIMASSYHPELARAPQFKVGLCQLLVNADKQRNIAHASRAIEDAAQKGAKLVLLPEIWNGPCSNECFPVYAEDIDAGGDVSPSTAMLSEVSHLLKITIVGGSIAERCGDHLYNTCCIFCPDGKLLNKHSKLHLFDIDIPGKITFIESKDSYSWAYSYCSRHRSTLDLLSWGIYQDYRTFALGLTTAGKFGEVLAATEHEEAIIIAEIGHSLIELRRSNLPLQKQRRGDVYQFVDAQRMSP